MTQSERFDPALVMNKLLRGIVDMQNKDDDDDINVMFLHDPR